MAADVGVICRALSHGLAERLPPTTLAALQCCCEELNAFIRDTGLWRKVTLGDELCSRSRSGASDLQEFLMALSRKGVREIFVDLETIDAELARQMLRLQDEASVRVSGRVRCVLVGRLPFSDLCAENNRIGCLDVRDVQMSRFYFYLFDFVARSFPDALVVIEGFERQPRFEGVVRRRTNPPIPVDLARLMPLSEVLRVVDAAMSMAGVKRVRLGTFSAVNTFLANDVDIDFDDIGDVFEDHVCCSGACNRVSDYSSERHVRVDIVDGLFSALFFVTRFDHAWNEWTVGADRPF